MNIKLIFFYSERIFQGFIAHSMHSHEMVLRLKVILYLNICKIKNISLLQFALLFPLYKFKNFGTSGTPHRTI